MTFYPNQLSENHRKMLFDESGIAPAIAAERSYATVRSRADLPEFKKYQRRAPALRVPIHSPDGETTRSQLRPDRPRRDKAGKVIKYETVGGSQCILDVHPRMRDEVRCGDGDLFVTEGIKKSDALTSRGLPTVGLIGVWNWQRGGEMLPCWDHVRLNGRRVYIVFDSDVMTKENVQLALERLVAALEARGAEVLVVYLPGPEKGVDDYLVAGGTVAELKMLAQKFEPQDIGRIRLSKDDRLKFAIEGLWGQWWAFDWGRMVGTGESPNSMRGHSSRDTMKVLIDAAKRHGKAVHDGVRVTISTRTIALKAATSRQTAMKSIGHLIFEGLLRREDNDRASDKACAYVLISEEPGRATLDHKGGNGYPEENVTSLLRSCDPGGKDLRAPRLRWSSPGSRRRRGLVRETRMVRQGPRPERRDGVKRLGKVRGSILDYLEDAGGVATVQEIAEGLHKSRPRDVRRRTLPLLEDDGLLTVEGDIVTLSNGWLDRLDEVREMGKEIAGRSGQDGAAERDAERYRVQREAFRRRGETAPDRHFANVGADGHVEDLQLEDDSAIAERAPEPVVSPLAEAIRNYLDRNAGDACQPPGWIGSTLWAFDLYPDKPTPAEIRAAIDELGGEAYLRRTLEWARRAA